MPSRAGIACTRPGCPGIVRHGVCSTCGPLRKPRMEAYDEQRGTSAERGYGYRWRQLRENFLLRFPLCAACLLEGRTVAATDVDHIVAKRAGGTDDESNLQSLCHACHSAKTMAGG
jgi:5-methylcytosine-specific restriction enzyme A